MTVAELKLIKKYLEIFNSNLNKADIEYLIQKLEDEINKI
jgi:hypothetical protein